MNFLLKKTFFKSFNTFVGSNISEIRKCPLKSFVCFKWPLKAESYASNIVERAQRTGLNFSIFPSIWRPNCSSYEKLVPRPQKSKLWKNEKKHPQIFTQATSVPNFSQIEPFLKPPGCPKLFTLFLPLLK